MGTVLPPWKLQLIEKKRKRLEQEKAKEKEKIDRYSNIPEWKRTILTKRKGIQEDPSVHNEDKPNATIELENDQISQNSQHTSKTVSRPRSSDGRSLHNDINSSNDKLIPKEKLENGDVVDGHSFVANCVPPSDKQRDEDQRTKLSNSHASREYDSEDDDEGRVLYEHIKTPSELRKLYELQVARRKALEEAQQTKDNLSSIRAKSLTDNQICQEDNIATKNRETPAKVKESRDQKPNSILAEQEIVKQTQKVKLSEEESFQATISPVVNEINHEHAIDNNKGQDKTELQNGEDNSSEIHIDAIRNKFGPSGKFRRRSVSTDNLLKSSSERTTPSSSPKPRPSPLNKRWSMITLTRGSEDNNESHGSLSRVRSLSDVRGEHPQPDAVQLRHRASVSHDIEHRIHELLHHSPLSDGNTSDEWDDDQAFTKEPPPQSPKKEEEPRKERRASWFNSEEVDKATKSIQISHLPQEDTSLSSQTKAKSNNEKSNKSAKEGNEISNQKPKNTVNNSSKKELTQEKQIIVHSAENSESSKPDLHDSEIEVNGESADDQNVKRPSVHKLSALFGSSILKSNKSSQKNKKVDTKNDLSKQESTKSNNNKSDSKGTSRKFPWTKKSSESNKTDNNIINNSNSEGKTFPFKGAQNLKPVQNKYVEQKLTGHMTLVIGGGTKSNQNYNHIKTPSNYPNTQAPAINKEKNVAPSSIRTIKKTSVDYDDEYITIIDVPNTTSKDDIEVSAIDIPEPHSPTPVSVIDIPESKDSAVKVSVIDVPQDSDSDSDSDSEISGSYDINPSGPSVYSFETDNSKSRDGDEEEEEDIDNVPVSYFGDSTYMKVPEVIFETQRENVKPILSSPLRNRKRKNKVVFHSEKLEKIHDYPSEVCLQSHYDQMMKEQGKGLANYQPSSLQNVNLSIQSLKPVESVKDENSNKKVKDAVKVTYSDDGEGFSTSSSSTGALLF